MGMAFWVRRFAVVFAAAFVLVAAAQLLRGHPTAVAASQGLVWTAVSTSIFIASRIHQSRQGRHCALCNDTPESPARSSPRT